MSYNNLYGTPYNPIPQVEMPPQREEVKRVNGRNGADMYRMAPNSTAILLDENNPMIWFLQTDSAGYKTITAYDISKHIDEQEKKENDFEERMKQFDERLSVIEEALK